MKKSFIFIFIIIVIIIGCYLSYSLASGIFKRGQPSRKIYKEYMWLIKDHKYLNKMFYSGYVSEKYNYNTFIYKKDYHISIWDFKDLKSIDLESISININRNLSLDNVIFDHLIPLPNSGLNPKISLTDSLDFKNVMHIFLDEKSCIDEYIEKPNCKGFRGEINRMIFGNGEKNIILFDYKKEKVATLLLLYKHNKGFYLIMVESKKPIDSKIIEIFNLQ